MPKVPEVFFIDNDIIPTDTGITIKWTLLVKHNRNHMIEAEDFIKDEAIYQGSRYSVDSYRRVRAASIMLVEAMEAA